MTKAEVGTGATRPNMLPEDHLRYWLFELPPWRDYMTVPSPELGVYLQDDATPTAVISKSEGLAPGAWSLQPNVVSLHRVRYCENCSEIVKRCHAVDVPGAVVSP